MFYSDFKPIFIGFESPVTSREAAAPMPMTV
nr:MAG TPA: hypothetical protein [Caudoviricetes sp.]